MEEGEKGFREKRQKRDTDRKREHIKLYKVNKNVYIEASKILIIYSLYSSHITQTHCKLCTMIIHFLIRFELSLPEW